MPAQRSSSADYGSHVPADLDPSDVDEVRRRIVDPVVRSLLRDHELESIQLRVVPENEDDDARVWIELVAVDESFQAPVVALRDQPVDPVDAAAWLYDALWDWLVETRFAWGQDRSGEYRVPPSSTV